MKSVMQHQFSQVPRVEIPRSVFNRSHGYKTTFDAGYLIPFYADEALPGDTFRANTSIFARLATPIVPIMDNLFIETFYFAVPCRLLWDNWQRFNGEQTDPGDSTDYLVPQIVANAEYGFQSGSISDYLGLPTGIVNLSVSALWHRAYNKIWNEWFRDQNLQDSLVVPMDDGPDSEADYSLQRRNKKHDYFTSCLPWPQKGPNVPLPIGSEAPVYGTENETFNMFDGTNNYGLNRGGTTALYAAREAYNGYPGMTGLFNTHPAGMTALGVAQKPNPSGLYADLSEAVAATVNEFREAIQVQRMYERDARGGSRYIEIIKSHFGVTSPDARMQRSEFLGSSSSRININPVQQTSESNDTPQGNLAAYGVGSDSSGGFTKSFTEHCIILGLVNVRADLTYQQGVPRMFSRQTRFDFYWPSLAHLGEQEVLTKEIVAIGTPSLDNVVFGYQERYAEYRYFPSQITGKFRSNDAQPLDIWHLSQEFSTQPVLNETFIQDNPPIDRIIAVPSEPHILFDSYINLHCARPMPVYGVPGLADHF